MQSKVVCLILAAGEAKRFGFPKQILPWRDSTILGYILEQACESDFEKVFVVLGAHFEKIKTKLKDRLSHNKIEVIYNKEWRKGMFESIKKGLITILNYDIDYVLIQLGDMPFVTKQVFNKFIKATNEKRKFFIGEECGRPAHPYMFEKNYIKKILKANLKNGMKDIIKEEFSNSYKINLPKRVSRQDIDTWEIYENLKNFKKI